MAPSDNIYRSEYDIVDGLIDERDMMEDDQYDIYDYDDDGQPDMDQEYADLYGYGDEYDCANDIYDYPEDWAV